MVKKILSLTLASIMTLSTASVAMASGDVTTLPTGTGTDVEGDGTGLGVPDSAITKFYMPTAKAFDFYFDPQGLTSLENGGAGATMSALEGGYIVMKGNAAEFINKCGYDVEVKADFSITAGSTLKIVTSNTKAVMETETTPGTPDPNALFYVQPSTANVKTVADSTATPPVVSEYAPTEKGIVVPSAGATLKFALPAADYSVTRTGESTFTAALKDATINGSALAIGGYVNPNASYTAITDASIKATFTVEKKAIVTDGATPTEFEDTTGIKEAYQLLKATPAYTLVEAVPTNSSSGGAPSATLSTTTWSSGTMTATVDWGTGASAATTIDMSGSKLTVKMGGTNTDFDFMGLVSAGFISVSNNVVTLNNTTLAAADNGSTIKLVIKFTDSATVIEKDITVSK